MSRSLLLLLSFFLVVVVFRRAMKVSSLDFYVSEAETTVNLPFDDKTPFYEVRAASVNTVLILAVPVDGIDWTVFTNKDLKLVSELPLLGQSGTPGGTMIQRYVLRFNGNAKVGEIILRGSKDGFIIWKQYRITLATSSMGSSSSSSSSTKAPLAPPPKKTPPQPPSPSTTTRTMLTPPPANPMSSEGWQCAQMPQSWADETLFVRVDAQGNLFCEANDINTGCNFRWKGVCQQMLQQGFRPARSFPVTRDAIRNNDWAQLGWLYTHNGSCQPLCDIIPKSTNELLKN